MRKFLAAVAMLSALAGSALAATSPNSFVTPQTPARGAAQFTSSSTPGTYATVYTAGTNGSKCLGLWMNNNDPTATHLVTVQIVNSSTKYGGAALTSVLSAGFASGTPGQNLMSSTIWPGLPVDNDGNPFLILISGDTLQATFATSITSSDLLNVNAVCTDF